jgi:hypothetical protein
MPEKVPTLTFVNFDRMQGTYDVSARLLALLHLSL